MATKKKKAKRSKARSTRKLSVANLRSATLASVKAALGRVPSGGIINGFVLDEGALSRLSVSPNALAKDITLGIAKATGLTLKPAVIRRPGGILVGFLPPTRLAP
jgi:hypothetical protein